jgi:hypothetical protein
MIRVFGLLLLLAMAPFAVAMDAEEGEVKAAIIYRMTLFMHWPSRAASEPLRICVLGRNAAAEALLRFPPPGSEPVHARRLEVNDSAAGCHLLYIGESSPELKRGVVTVTDQALRPGVIHLEIENARVVFDVDLAQARAAGVELRAQLLKLARKVSGISP